MKDNEYIVTEEENGRTITEWTGYSSESSALEWAKKRAEYDKSKTVRIFHIKEIKSKAPFQP